MADHVPARTGSTKRAAATRTLNGFVMYATSIEELMAVADANELSPRSRACRSPAPESSSCARHGRPATRTELNADIVSSQTGISHLVRVSAGRHIAPLKVFSIRQLMVIGPVPPGIGVMAPAIACTSLKSTSPWMPSAARLMPTSSTAALAHELGGDETSNAHGGDDDVGLPADRGQIARTAVGKRRRGIAALAAEQENLGNSTSVEHR